MDDPYHPVPTGTIGIVDHVDDAGTIHMKWENGSSLGLIEGQDQFEVIKPKIKKNLKEWSDKNGSKSQKNNFKT